jgi:hypothetical protein
MDWIRILDGGAMICSLCETLVTPRLPIGVDDWVDFVKKFNEKHQGCGSPERLMRSLKDAIAFYELCEKDPKSRETGAYRDAVEWVVQTARRLARNAP